VSGQVFQVFITGVQVHVQLLNSVSVELQGLDVLTSIAGKTVEDILA
jgi:hypothetical protein